MKSAAEDPKLVDSHLYDPVFFDRREEGVRRSAAVIVPLLTDLLEPGSVVDVGCATGLWLAAFQDLGVKTVTGIDGPWVPCKRLQVPHQHFFEYDFGAAPLPIAPKLPRRRYDVALCLELLEHLPAERADPLLDWLCSVSDTLIVSAAVPLQGGTGHVNEQWPAYWREKFASRGFQAFDFLRLAIWGDRRIAPWYRQNIIGYFKGDVPAAVADFAQARMMDAARAPRALSHPEIHAHKLARLTRPVRNPLAEGWRWLGALRAARRP